MRDFLAEAMKGYDAEYIDVRVEERRATRISFRGRDLEEIGENTDRGGNVRALVKGGWGFVCFNDLDDLRSKVAQAAAIAHRGDDVQQGFHSTSRLGDYAPNRQLHKQVKNTGERDIRLLSAAPVK